MLESGKYCRMNERCVLMGLFLRLVQFDPPDHLINFVGHVRVELREVDCTTIGNVTCLVCKKKM